jgi:hypothetical protein
MRRSDFAAKAWHQPFMKLMRAFLRDRISASAIAALVAYILLLQGFAGAFAQGAMAASASDPIHVICSSNGDGAVDPAQSGSGKKPVDCPCANLCRLGASAMPAVPTPHIVVLHAASGIDAPVFVPPGQRPHQPLRGLIGQPRAPPISL